MELLLEKILDLWREGVTEITEPDPISKGLIGEVFGDCEIFEPESEGFTSRRSGSGLYVQQF